MTANHHSFSGSKTETHSKQKTSTLLHSFLTELPVAAALLCDQGNILSCNQHFCSLLQSDEANLKGQYFLNDLGEPDDSKSPVTLPDFHTLNDKPYENKYVFCRNGQNILLRISINPIEDNADDRIAKLLIAEDITELEHTKLHLKQTLSRYETVMKATKDAIWDYNLQTGESYSNHALFEIFGYTPRDLKDNNRWWRQNIHPEDKERVIDKITDIIDSEINAWQDEYRFRTADGNYKFIQDRCVILRDENGQAYRIIGAMSDITEERQTLLDKHERDLMQKMEIAETIIEAQEKERRRISEELHDNVNQILATVKLFIEHIRHNNCLKEGDLLEQCSDHLTEAIGELRNISHNLSTSWLERQGLKFAVTKLATTLESLKGISFDIDMDEFNEAAICKNRLLIIFRIIQEQFQNILKHSRATKVSITLKNRTGEGLLCISDNGVGTICTEGSEGIGLKNIHSRVEVMAGSMSIFTAPGNGFTLRVEF